MIYLLNIAVSLPSEPCRGYMIWARAHFYRVDTAVDDEFVTAARHWALRLDRIQRLSGFTVALPIMIEQQGGLLRWEDFI